MKKKTLHEELERIHVLTYGKQFINEDGFVDKLLNLGTSKKEEDKPKVDDPKKADLVSKDVSDFYETLQDAANGGGLKQQMRGSIEWQKGVESMQIGLILLGYELPRFGVDGLFGPETGAAVAKFTEEKVKKQVKENITIVPDGANNIIGAPGAGTHNAGDWQSRNAWDVTGNVGSEVKSITAGTVSKVREVGGLKKSNGKIIYGDQVTIKSDNGPEVFYTHIKTAVKVGDKVSIGSTIGTIMTIGGIPPHVHIGLSSGNIKDFADVKGNVAGGKVADLKVATPEMLNKQIELLKDRGVTSEDLNKHIDKVTTGGSAEFTDVDLTTDEGFRKYTEICDKYIATRQPNPLEIKGEMLATGARRAFERHHKYVPPELALSQLVVEGGVGNGKLESRPIRTKNPYNVGNTDDGSNIEMDNVQEGINTYFELIASRYLGKGKTAKDLVQNFVNNDGNHYATAGTYEKLVNQVAAQANKVAKTVA